LKLPTDNISSIIQSVTTDIKFPSVITDWITDGKVYVVKKKTGRWRGGFGGLFFQTGSPTDSKRQPVQRAPFILPTDLKWQIRTVTCLLFRQNHRRFHRQSVRRWNRREKLIYVQSTDLLLPYFFFFFLISTLPICKQPATPSPQTKISLISAQQVIFLEVLWSQHPCSDLPTDFINFCK